MGLKNYIQNLQQRPYAQRLRIFWTIFIISGILVAIIWLTLARIYPVSSSATPWLTSLGEDWNRFTTAIKNVGSNKTANTDNPAMAKPRIVSILNYNTDNPQKLLKITFQVENSQADILNFFNPERKNIYLIDGNRKLFPQAILTAKNDPFPVKILGHTTVTGSIAFESPQSDKVNFQIESMFYEGQSQSIFNEVLELNLRAEVKGIKTNRLPRQ